MRMVLTDDERRGMLHDVLIARMSLEAGDDYLAEHQLEEIVKRLNAICWARYSVTEREQERDSD